MTDTLRLHADDAIRLGRLLRFTPAVQARFEQDTGPERVRQLRQTIVLGLVFYNAYDVTSFLVLPDMLWANLVLRLLIMTPVALGIAWAVGHLPPRRREIAVLAGMTCAAAVPAYLLWASHSPYVSVATSQMLLTMVFATMVLMLRFPHAVLFVFANVAMSVPGYYWKDGVPSRVALELVLQMVIAACFVLYGNYRMERNARRSYLVALRSSLRSADLQVDKIALERLSRADPLTGVANRRRLSERLLAWHADAANHDRLLAVVMVDVDHFKRYNDEHGHLAGDVCLSAIAQAMAGCLRDDRDLLVRYGGEEFAVLLPGADAAEAGAVAQRLCSAVTALGLPHGRRDDGMSVVTVSAGVASEPVNGRRRARALFEAADAALYAAKTRGRNQHVVAVPSDVPSTAAPSDLAPLAPDGW